MVLPIFIESVTFIHCYYLLLDVSPGRKSLLGFNLTPATSANVWQKAFEGQFSEQKMFDNIATEVAKFFTRYDWKVFKIFSTVNNHQQETSNIFYLFIAFFIFPTIQEK